MKQGVAWMKEHLLIVVFCVTIVAALAGGWFGSVDFNATVRAKAEDQARRFGELATAENGSITISLPGATEPISGKGVINAAVVEQYGRAIGVLSEDAGKIQRAALARNLNGRDPYDPKAPVAPFLPRVNAAKASLLRYDAQAFFAAEYARLLAEVHTGAAPSTDEVMARLEASRLNFINQDLRKPDAASLTPEEKSKLDQKLGSDRIGLLETAALGVSFFCDPADLSIPTATEAKALNPEASQLGAYEQTLFDWQWRFWITEDLLHAFYAANQDGSKELVPELRAPVKQILSIAIEPMRRGGSSSADGNGSENASSGDAAPFGGSTADASSASADASSDSKAQERVALGAPQIDTSTEAARDYSKSFTGRSSNGIYDVRRVTVVFVAETAAIPVVLDALSKENFMTVVNLKLAPADAFAAAAQGFAYGLEPVSTITLELETVWFREWTAFFMPESVRASLGIASGTAAADGSSDGSSGS